MSTPSLLNDDAQGSVLHLTPEMMDAPMSPPTDAPQQGQLTYTIEGTWGGKLLVRGEERAEFTQLDVSSGFVTFVSAVRGGFTGFQFKTSAPNSPTVHKQFVVDLLTANVTGAAVSTVRLARPSSSPAPASWMFAFSAPGALA